MDQTSENELKSENNKILNFPDDEPLADRGGCLQKRREAEEIDNPEIDPLDYIPPNFEECENHKTANFMREPIFGGKNYLDDNKESNAMICPCCNKNYNNKKYSMCDSTNTFGIHGFGISLYFAMMRYLIYLC